MELSGVTNPALECERETAPDDSFVWDDDAAADDCVERSEQFAPEDKSHELRGTKAYYERGEGFVRLCEDDEAHKRLLPASANPSNTHPTLRDGDYRPGQALRELTRNAENAGASLVKVCTSLPRQLLPDDKSEWTDLEPATVVDNGSGAIHGLQKLVRKGLAAGTCTPPKRTSGDNDLYNRGTNTCTEELCAIDLVLSRRTGRYSEYDTIEAALWPRIGIDRCECLPPVCFDNANHRLMLANTDALFWKQLERHTPWCSPECLQRLIKYYLPSTGLAHIMLGTRQLDEEAIRGFYETATLGGHANTSLSIEMNGVKIATTPLLARITEHVFRTSEVCETNGTKLLTARGGTTKVARKVKTRMGNKIPYTVHLGRVPENGDTACDFQLFVHGKSLSVDKDHLRRRYPAFRRLYQSEKRASHRHMLHGLAVFVNIHNPALRNSRHTALHTEENEEMLVNSAVLTIYALLRATPSLQRGLKEFSFPPGFLPKPQKTTKKKRTKRCTRSNAVVNAHLEQGEIGRLDGEAAVAAVTDAENAAMEEEQDSTAVGHKRADDSRQSALTSRKKGKTDPRSTSPTKTVTLYILWDILTGEFKVGYESNRHTEDELLSRYQCHSPTKREYLRIVFLAHNDDPRAELGLHATRRASKIEQRKPLKFAPSSKHSEAYRYTHDPLGCYNDLVGDLEKEGHYNTLSEDKVADHRSLMQNPLPTIMRHLCHGLGYSKKELLGSVVGL